MVFDKTGTLTRGNPVVKQTLCAPGFEAGECLQIAASIESNSEHPLARALLRAAATSADRTVVSIVNVPGCGVSAEIDARNYFVGSAEFVVEQTGQQIPPDWREQLLHDSGAAVLLARSDRLMALFIFADELRDDARELVEELRERGKTVILMTGDREIVARNIAAECAIEDYRAALSPQQKMTAVAELQASGAEVLMVGDGVNDAPVLARADVSIAMGGASSLAKTSADIVLTADRLLCVADLLERSTRTQRVIRQNMIWALLYNFSAIPAAAAGLVAPWLAALGMSLSSLLVVLNALRLTR